MNGGGGVAGPAAATRSAGANGELRRARKTASSVRLVSLPPPSPDFYEEDTLAAAGAHPREKPMGFLDHLEELRGTLIKCAVVFAIMVTVIAYNLKDFSRVMN